LVRPNDSHMVNMVQAASGKNVATYEMMNRPEEVDIVNMVGAASVKIYQVT